MLPLNQLEEMVKNLSTSFITLLLSYKLWKLFSLFHQEFIESFHFLVYWFAQFSIFLLLLFFRWWSGFAPWGRWFLDIILWLDLCELESELISLSSCFDGTWNIFIKIRLCRNQIVNVSQNIARFILFHGSLRCSFPFNWRVWLVLC